jgi:hypothetical protein
VARRHRDDRCTHTPRHEAPKKDGVWVPQYTLRRQDTKNQVSDFLSHQAQLDKTFPTESAADDFALQEAMKWIDKNSKLKS